MRKILVIGSGGREAAIVLQLAQSSDTSVFCAPGNAGIAEHATCVPIKATDIGKLLAFALENAIDLTIVGPEASLVAGIVGRFRAAGLLICGPTAMAARAEGSKEWFKRFLDRNGFVTADFSVFVDRDAALANIRERGVLNIVIKADGLMGGKGVTLPNDLAEAEADLAKLMVKGSAGEAVVIENRLVGVERSVMAITDGKNIYMLPFTQDYKREFDGDRGLNTGGMGAHTLDLPEEEELELETILRNVVEAFAREWNPYTGFIYLGIMMTADGPMILECNCRLGDPETQAILASIDGDFADLCQAAAEGNLTLAHAPKQVRHALCLVLASAAYPDTSGWDDAIIGLVDEQSSTAVVLHAGTAQKDGRVTTNKSGRVLNVVGVGDTIAEARECAYDRARRISFPGIKYRKDIGADVI